MASKTVTRSIASQEFCSVLPFLFFINLCPEYRLNEVYASVATVAEKNYLNMKELSFLGPTGSGIVTFRDYKLSS